MLGAPLRDAAAWVDALPVLTALLVQERWGRVGRKNRRAAHSSNTGPACSNSE